MSNLSEILRNTPIGTEAEVSQGPLVFLAGSWRGNSTVTCLAEDGSETQMNHEGNYINSLILGGYFLQMNSSELIDGVSYSSLGILGFDAIEKKFVEFWADSFGQTYTAEGQYNAEQQTITLEGDYREVGHEAKLRSEYKVMNHNSYMFNLSLLQPDGSVKLLKDMVFGRA